MEIKSEESIEELEEKLNTYKESYLQVENALKADPSNNTLLSARDQLMEVINLTQEVLKGRKQPLVHRQAETTTVVESSAKKSIAQKEKDKRKEEGERTNGGESGPLSVGSKCRALYREDGQFYDAVIKSIDNGRYTVEYIGYNEIAENLGPEDVRGKAQKRGIKEQHFTVNEVTGEVEIPKSLKILPEDSDEVRNQKRRRIHAIKYAHKMNQLEESTNTKKNAWQQFNQNVSKKPKTGFLSGRQKESIFKSPDSVDGKVGVTGSGQSITAQPVFKATEVKRIKKKLNM